MHRRPRSTPLRVTQRPPCRRPRTRRSSVSRTRAASDSRYTTRWRREPVRALRGLTDSDKITGATRSAVVPAGGIDGPEPPGCRGEDVAEVVDVDVRVRLEVVRAEVARSGLEGDDTAVGRDGWVAGVVVALAARRTRGPADQRGRAELPVADEHVRGDVVDAPVVGQAVVRSEHHEAPIRRETAERGGDAGRDRDALRLAGERWRTGWQVAREDVLREGDDRVVPRERDRLAVGRQRGRVLSGAAGEQHVRRRCQRRRETSRSRTKTS